MSQAPKVRATACRDVDCREEAAIYLGISGSTFDQMRATANRGPQTDRGRKLGYS
jgi:hypothetical protein